VKFLPCGTHHLLIEADSLDEILDCYSSLEAHRPRGVVDMVPAARTVLIEFDTSKTNVATLQADVEALDSVRRVDSDDSVLNIDVRYDGEDLDYVRAFLGYSPEELIAWHTGQTWEVAFTGFAPGFGYLVGDLHQTPIPRMEAPRVDVPAGSVALAGEFTGIYPRNSPGGWRIIGHTDAPLWDLDREPPALLVPGTRVQFVAVS
jgi:KipI family sensor histidine kinase inhibitor